MLDDNGQVEVVHPVLIRSETGPYSEGSSGPCYLLHCGAKVKRDKRTGPGTMQRKKSGARKEEEGCL